jgi:hypothetical protein
LAALFLHDFTFIAHPVWAVIPFSADPSKVAAIEDR